MSPEENFPGQQNGKNCAPQACQQIIKQATGVDYSEGEMADRAQRTGAYDPARGTTVGGEADILNASGVPAHTEAPTPENIQKALDSGQGVITGHSAGRLWKGDPNYEADPAYPMDDVGHAVHTTGLVRDGNGNVTHYVINDTGTGTAGRMVPVDQFHQSLDTGPAAITDAPIRTPAAAREAAPVPDAAPTAPEGTTAPRDAASRGDPVSERSDPASEERTPSEAQKPGASERPGDTPEAKTKEEEGKAAGSGDPTVPIGDRPGGLRGTEDEDGPGAENNPEAAPSTREAVPKDLYKKLRGKTPSEEIKKLVNDGKVFPHDDPVLKGRQVTKNLHPDHTVSMKTITEMKDLDKLSFENQVKVLNHEPNFRGLSESANTAKQEKSWEEFKFYKEGKPEEIKVDDTIRQEMIQKSKDLTPKLQDLIQSLLPKPPP